MKKEIIEVESLTKIAIVWEEGEDITLLGDDEKFKELILTKTYKSITKAIKSGEDTIELFDVPNHGVIIEISKENYKPALQTIQSYFIDKEEYEECIKIQKLLKKL
jgi:hypothetical protein